MPSKRRSLLAAGKTAINLVWLFAALMGCSGSPDGSSTPDAGAELCGDPLTACGASCTNLGADPHNCGACGVVCGAGQACADGECSLSCQPGLTNCDGVCANTDPSVPT